MMQVPLTMHSAWNWEENTQVGARIFEEKRRAALRLERLIRRQHHGLPPLDDVQRENMALVLYGPEGYGDLGLQYYTVERDLNGYPHWVENNTNNPMGVKYAKDVRTLAR